ncbi:diaminopimelate decarboxylase, partial [Streptococcus suis]
FINLTGGIGVKYSHDHEPKEISVIGDGVLNVYDEILTPSGIGHVKIFTEFGRVIFAPQRQIIKKFLQSKENKRKYIFLDSKADKQNPT